MKTCLFKYIENCTTKNSDIFHISAQNIDCGYLLEQPCQGGSNQYQQSMFLSRNNKNKKPTGHGRSPDNIATADMQILCNIFPILSLQLMKGSF